jgi:hypothetical protein
MKYILKLEVTIPDEDKQYAEDEGILRYIEDQGLINLEIKTLEERIIDE